MSTSVTELADQRHRVRARQLAVCGIVAALFATMAVCLYWQDRSREWRLRVQQAEHRLDVASELISRELNRVRSDALFLADQRSVREFAAGRQQLRSALEAEYASFVRHKKTYDQIRLLDIAGQETIRVNYHADGARVIPASELQDKEDRYYVRESRCLPAGEVFVSDFDLNLEHGVIERPLKPVIRFVAPVFDGNGARRGLLVVNYLGARLLTELQRLSIPGNTLLLTADGDFVLGPRPGDAWGWLLGHDRSFDSQFPAAWQRVAAGASQCQLTPEGVFASRPVPLGWPVRDTADDDRSVMRIVSFLPRDQVFADSAKLLRRLFLLAAGMTVPLIVLARHWAQASVGRAMQALRVARSEASLRELSSRLLRIQEEERRAISREIHDEFGQQVTAINLDLKLADRNLPSENARPHLERAIRENEQLLQTLHAFAKRVRPAVLDDLGLHDAVESHVWDFENRTGITVQATLDFDSGQIPPVIAENAYRLLQESLNNVARHAGANVVDIAMWVDHHAAEPTFRMTVADNGRGCEPQNLDGSRLGLVGMQERVTLLGGHLQILSPEEQGTRVEVAIPLPTAQDGGDPP
jgi:signal transduction histidine kinase